MPEIPAIFRIPDSEESQTGLIAVRMSDTAIEGGSAPVSTLVAYGTFVLFAIAYFWLYLPEGFSLYDDGYLLGLGQRVSGGEIIYSDFYFFRTPLSVYWQAGWITLFGSYYTVLASKIIWALQITVTVGIASLIYRRWLSPVLLTLTLCAALVYSSMLLSFAWYTYDAMFFTAVFAFLFHERRYLPAGIAAGLAFLCKQSFAALIPITFIVWLIALALSRNSLRDWRRALKWCSVGALSVVAILAGVLALQGSLGDFWQNVFVLPVSANPLPVSFMLVQNLPEVAAEAWPFVLVLSVALLARPTRWSSAGIVAAAIVAFGGDLLIQESSLGYHMTALFYVVLLFGIALAVFTVRKKGGAVELDGKVKLYAVSLAALYLAGLNYSGWDFANMGGVLALPAVIVFLSGRDEIGTRRELVMSEGVVTRIKMSLRGGRLQALVFGLGALGLALMAHDRFAYSQSERAELVTPFRSAMLAGMFGEAGQVGEVDSVVNYVSTNTEENEAVFSFPDFTALNYLTSRPAWGSVQWYYRREFDYDMALETAELLCESPPRLAVVRTHWRDQSLADEPFEYVDLDREAVILDALMENMTAVDTIGRFLLMRPCSETKMIKRDNLSVNTLSGASFGSALENNSGQ